MFKWCVYSSAVGLVSILWKWRTKTLTKFHLTGPGSVGMLWKLVRPTTISLYCRTKQVTRFHPPYVLEDVQLLAQHSELLVANAKQAWNEFLRFRNWLLKLPQLHVPLCSDFGMQYGACKKAVDLLATLDCLLSLAAVAVMPGYVW